VQGGSCRVRQWRSRDHHLARLSDAAQERTRNMALDEAIACAVERGGTAYLPLLRVGQS
jgi:hypothetical protein